MTGGRLPPQQGRSIRVANVGVFKHRAPTFGGRVRARWSGLRSCPHDKSQSIPGGVSDSLVGRAFIDTPTSDDHLPYRGSRAAVRQMPGSGSPTSPLLLPLVHWAAASAAIRV